MARRLFYNEELMQGNCQEGNTSSILHDEDNPIQVNTMPIINTYSDPFFGIPGETFEETIMRRMQRSIHEKKPRLHWTPELHQSFMHAVEQLGGKESATPKTILEVMNVEELEISHIKSHLQAIRRKDEVKNEENHESTSNDRILQSERLSNNALTIDDMEKQSSQGLSGESSKESINLDLSLSL